jgi:SAM-dependent methyltransferase
MEDLVNACSNNYFTELAKYYDVTHQWRNYDMQTSFLHEVIQQYKKDCKYVIDLACGTGEHAYRLSKEGYQITGIDNSEEMLAIASKKSDTPNWLLGDFLTFESLKHFDIAYCLGMTVHYIYSPDTLVVFLSRVKDILSPAGIFIIDMINPWFIINWASTNHFHSADISHQIYILEKSEMDKKSRIRHNDYTWFVNDKDKRWQRYDLFENLKLWFIDEIENVLNKAGLEILAINSDYNMERLNLEKDFNVVFVAKRS